MANWRRYAPADLEPNNALCDAFVKAIREKSNKLYEVFDIDTRRTLSEPLSFEEAHQEMDNLTRRHGAGKLGVRQV